VQTDSFLTSELTKIETEQAQRLVEPSKEVKAPQDTEATKYNYWWHQEKGQHLSSGQIPLKASSELVLISIAKQKRIKHKIEKDDGTI
jgi:hypothetical protein